MGEGLGLNISSSFWVYGPNLDGVVEDRILYTRSERDSSVKTHYADELEHYIRCGWLSSLHTCGRTGAGFSRDQAAKALDVLADIGDQHSVWTNHGRDGAQNIRMAKGTNKEILGDVPNAASYHADLLPNAGIRYFWPGTAGVTVGGTRRPAWPAKLANGQKV
jgi:hypothetical protein